MKRCCKCEKLVLPWSQSKISVSTIHKKCHEEALSKTPLEKPELKQMCLKELSSFEKYTSVKTKLEI